MSSDNPADQLTDKIIREGAHGVADAILDRIDVKKWIKKFNAKELRFVGNLDNIDLAKEQKKTPEWCNYSRYITNKDLGILVQMGITLRKLDEKENAKDRLDHLRKVILKKYDLKGLHVAQFVQNGILGKYLETQLAKAKSDADITERLENFLKEIDKFCFFITGTENVVKKGNEIVSRMHALCPPTVVLYAIGSATKPAMVLQKRIQKETSDYKLEEYFQANKKLIFFNKINV